MDVVAVDLRAHGNSGGKYCTFGLLEKIDLKNFIMYLLETEKINKNIGIWAQSLGGAIALQCMAKDKRIKYGIIESTYSRLDVVIKEFFSNYLSLEQDFVVDYLMSRLANIGEFNPDLVNPIDYCKNIDEPILLVHGIEDGRISTHHGKRNFEEMKTANKEFISIQNANHTNLWRTGGEH